MGRKDREMKKPNGPCEGCKDRVAENPEEGTRDCHRTCEKYKAYKEQVEAYHTYLKNEKGNEIVANNRPWLSRKKRKKAVKRYEDK